jgi:hypothetical protein
VTPSFPFATVLPGRSSPCLPSGASPTPTPSTCAANSSFTISSAFCSSSRAAFLRMVRLLIGDFFMDYHHSSPSLKSENRPLYSLRQLQHGCQLGNEMALGALD